MRQISLFIVGVSLLAGCTTSPSSSAVSVTGPSSLTLNQVSGQALTVEPTSRHFDCLNPVVPVTVTASTNFAGAITAVRDNPDGCLLSAASQDAVGTPGSGGTKRATFVVTPTWGCTVTFTDKKGNTATLRTSVDQSGSSCI
jgi:hypothetical protein